MPRLFFFEEESDSDGLRTEKEEIARLHGCNVCPLNKAKVFSPKMRPKGDDGDVDVYILGDFPDALADNNEVPIAYPNNQPNLVMMLRREMSGLRIRHNNVIRTRPPDDLYNPDALACCRKSVEDDILASNPKVILGLGNIPIRWFGMEGEITLWRGRRAIVRIGKRHFWFMATHHPKRIRADANAVKKAPHLLTKIMNFDIASVVKLVKENSNPNDAVFDMEGFPRTLWRGGDKEFHALMDKLEELKTGKFAFDYETFSGEGSYKKRNLRPYGKGCGIATIGFADKERSYAFALHHPQSGWTPKQTEHIERKWREVLRSPDNQKVCHNLAYEAEWSIKFFGGSSAVESMRTFHDTMAMGYMLDSRMTDTASGESKRKSKGLLSLNAMCQLHLGVPVKRFSNVNLARIAEEPLGHVLRYNAMDCSSTFQLTGRLVKQLKERGIYDEYRAQTDRILAATIMQRQGIPVNVEFSQGLAKEMSDTLDDISSKLLEMESVREARRRVGDRFKFSNRDHLMVLFKDVLGRTEVKQVDKFKKSVSYSVDKSVLEQIDTEESKQIRKWTGVHKLFSTFVSPVTDSDKGWIWADGRVHPYFNACGTETRRFSSDSPNFQNLSKRDFELSPKVRRQFKVKPGYTFIEYDYGQLETRVFAMVVGEGNLRRDIMNGVDIHTYWRDFFYKSYPKWLNNFGGNTEKEKLKSARTDIKSLWTFPLFYGASLGETVKRMRLPPKECEGPYAAFREYFSDVFGWQEKNQEFYDTHGYVELCSGFRRQGPLSKHAVCNTPCQGTGCDVASHALTSLVKRALAEKDKHMIPVFYIHDSLTFIVPTSELDHYTSVVVEEMLRPTADLDYVNVPLLIEGSKSSDGGTWGDMEEYCIRDSMDMFNQQGDKICQHASPTP